MTSSIEDAVVLHRAGRLADAERAYRGVLQSEPNHAGALHLLGVVRHQQGDHDSALDLIGQAISLDPTKAIYLNNYGAALQSLRRFDEALAAFHRAIGILRGYADALANRGMAYVSLGREEEALADFQEALRIEPRHRDAQRRLISLVHRLGRTEEAIGLCQSAIAVQPCAEFHGKLGELLIDSGRPEAALIALRKAIEMEPVRAVAQFNMALALESLHLVPEAQGHFQQAAQLSPKNPFRRLRALTTASAVLQSTDEANAFRERLSSALFGWRAAAPALADLDEIHDAGAIPGLAFSYQGRDNRRLKEQFAAIYEPYFRGLPPPTGSGLGNRRRIGIVVTEHHETMFLSSMRGVVENLDAQRFELVILCSRRIVETLRNSIRRVDLRFVFFDQSLADAIRQIREAVCDLIYYWEVGSDATNYFLPFARLAPVQCTGWGSTITSGLPAVDYFLSTELVERPGSQSQYTERLWKSRTLFRYQQRLPATPPASPTEFGLPDDRHLYVCFQNPLKLHPDFDPLLAGVLEADPLALVVLLADPSGHVAGLIKERFARRIPQAAARIVFLPPQPFNNYCRLLQLADVILDPPHYGAGSSCYDLFSFDLPVVTCPGELIVGRITQACYRKMDVEDLIVHSAEEYVSKAVQVATDRDYRRYVTQRIANKSDVLFNDMEVVHEHERFFEEAASRVQ